MIKKYFFKTHTYIFYDSDKSLYDDTVHVDYGNVAKTFYYHRDNGLPALIYILRRHCITWFVDNQCHRWNGPADNELDSWSINNTPIIAEDYFEFLDANGIDINNLRPEDKLLITMWAG